MAYRTCCGLRSQRLRLDSLRIRREIARACGGAQLLKNEVAKKYCQVIRITAEPGHASQSFQFRPVTGLNSHRTILCQNSPPLHIIVSGELQINVTARPCVKAVKNASLALQPKGVTQMRASLNVAENGGGRIVCWLSCAGSWYMIFVSIWDAKISRCSRHKVLFSSISNSPFVSWLSLFGLRGEAYFLGVVELRRCLRQVPSARSCQPSVFLPLLGHSFSLPGSRRMKLSTDPIA